MPATMPQQIAISEIQTISNSRYGWGRDGIYNEKIAALKELIKRNGYNSASPIEIYPLVDGNFGIETGHMRSAACKQLIEEGHVQLAPWLEPGHIWAQVVEPPKSTLDRVLKQTAENTKVAVQRLDHLTAIEQIIASFGERKTKAGAVPKKTPPDIKRAIERYLTEVGMSEEIYRQTRKVAEFYHPIILDWVHSSAINAESTALKISFTFLYEMMLEVGEGHKEKINSILLYINESPDAIESSRGGGNYLTRSEFLKLFYHTYPGLRQEKQEKAENTKESKGAKEAKEAKVAKEAKAIDDDLDLLDLEEVEERIYEQYVKGNEENEEDNDEDEGLGAIQSAKQPEIEKGEEESTSSTSQKSSRKKEAQLIKLLTSDEVLDALHREAWEDIHPETRGVILELLMDIKGKHSPSMASPDLFLESLDDGKSSSSEELDILAF
jgi:hypothetical protein